MADDQPELHELTKMLLLRMDVHPEEFFDNFGHPAPYKWRHALQSVEHYGRPEDKQALYAAYMDHALRVALKTLLAPEEPTVGQNPVGIPNTGNMSVVAPNHYGVFGGNGGNGGNGGPYPAMQQAQQAQARAQAALMQAHQPMRANSVTISPSAARAMGLKPPTVNETFVEAYERIKKRLGL